MHKSEPRARLTESDAITIFNLRGVSTSAIIVGKAYNVSEKAIRDIWKGRTWKKVTWHLDLDRHLRVKRPRKPAGKKQLIFLERGAKLNIDHLASSEPHESDSQLPTKQYPHADIAVQGPTYPSSFDIKTIDAILYGWEQSAADPNVHDPFAEDLASVLASLVSSSLDS